MELIKTKKYSIHNRHFDIHIYSDRSSDSLVIKPEETTEGKKEDVSHLKSFVHMKGVFDVKPEEYPEFEEALDAVKELLSTHVSTQLKEDKS